MKDITYRAKETLSGVDIIICENIKRSLKLLSNLDINKKLYSLHDHNEEKIIEKVKKYHINNSIALISDAGSPLISDPGYNLVKFYIKNNLYVTSVPGPCSLINALQVSSIASNQFQYLGFAPKTKKAMDEFLNEILTSSKTSVFFVSSHKILLCLKLINKNISSREICVCKELTKLNEKIFVGLSDDVIKKFTKDANNTRGEFVVIIGPDVKKQDDSEILIESHKNNILKLLKKFSLTDVVEIVHKFTKISKKEIYRKALELKK